MKIPNGVGTEVDYTREGESLLWKASFLSGGARSWSRVGGSKVCKIMEQKDYLVTCSAKAIIHHTSLRSSDDSDRNGGHNTTCDPTTLPAPCLNSSPSRPEYNASAFLNATTFFCLILSSLLASVRG
jgi:hypothetical protein